MQQDYEHDGVHVVEAPPRPVLRRREPVRRQDERCRQACCGLEGQSERDLHRQRKVPQCFQVPVGVHRRDAAHKDLCEGEHDTNNAVLTATGLHIRQEVHVDAHRSHEDVHPRQDRDGVPENYPPQDRHDDNGRLGDDEVATRRELRLAEEAEDRGETEKTADHSELSHVRGIEASHQHVLAACEICPEPMREQGEQRLNKQCDALVV
mmetsp:Transcript_67046/g.193725  ORF Transcript_67046/g.193725 Transcript_67046/m.193725 type:complete len:208 (-) Transcript_67046:800-1423(-)